MEGKYNYLLPKSVFRCPRDNENDNSQKKKMSLPTFKVALLKEDIKKSKYTTSSTPASKGYRNSSDGKGEKKYFKKVKCL